MKRSILKNVDLEARVGRQKYETRLAALQHKLTLLQQAYLGRRERAIIIFEGWDAAGKGGTIRRLAWALDPRGFKVWPIAAPDERERRHHYLHRFWQRLPGHGEIAVFDRSWYGRVLVERVEGFASKQEWSRAYQEINDFEAMLLDDGARIVKLFLHVSPEVQRERFRRRFEDPLKRWKLTYEDLRNWSKRDAYTEAIEEMLARTSPRQAPWHVVPADDKLHARIRCLEIIAKALGKGISVEPRRLDDALAEEARQHLGLALETGVA